MDLTIERMETVIAPDVLDYIFNALGSLWSGFWSGLDNGLIF